MEKLPDTHSYKGWLNSDNFMKRAFAIYGYNFVASLIISAVIIIPIMIIIFVVFGAAIFGGARSGGFEKYNRYEDQNPGSYNSAPEWQDNSYQTPEEVTLPQTK